MRFKLQIERKGVTKEAEWTNGLPGNYDGGDDATAVGLRCDIDISLRNRSMDPLASAGPAAASATDAAGVAGVTAVESTADACGGVDGGTDST